MAKRYQEINELIPFQPTAWGTSGHAPSVPRTHHGSLQMHNPALLHTNEGALYILDEDLEVFLDTEIFTFMICHMQMRLS